MSFEDYFSDEAIIRELCKARVSLANQRHEALFFHNIDRSRPSGLFALYWRRGCRGCGLPEFCGFRRDN
jgi:hypothetical protein